MALLYAENWSKLMLLAPQQELVLEVIKHVFVNIFLENTRDSKARQAFDTMLCDLIALFRDCPRPFFFKILNETFTSIPKMVSSWLSLSFPVN